MSTIEFPEPLLAALRTAARVAVLTGAGVSAESGVPTFREAQKGLWAQYDPQELATAAAFRRNHRLVWRWYQWRRQLVSRARPNPGHYALAAMETLVRRMTLITQNVDGLHEQAGSQAILELHGNIQRNRCFLSDHAVEESSQIPPEDPHDPPRCPLCHSFLRPDVVWFGEPLPADVLRASLSAVEKSDVFLIIGTSAVVHPAAALPLMAAEAGATTVEINLSETPVSAFLDYKFREPSGTLLPQLVRAAWPHATIDDVDD